jgi:hypothetical protein
MGLRTRLFCALVGLMAAAVSPRLSTGYLRTEDLNGDGRPDVWRAYDRDGHLSSVAIDVNFDGRPDVEERYEGGVLVRRDTDRNFDGRTDRVDEFDAATSEQVRSVEDVDFDGAGDLLGLFRDGRSVAWRWVDRATSAGAPEAVHSAAADAAGHQPLAPLRDPFRHDRGIRAVHRAATIDACVTGSKCGAPAVRGDVVTSLAASVVAVSTRFHPPSAPNAPYSPRPPPAALRS